MGVAGADLWEMAEVRNRVQRASTSLYAHVCTDLIHAPVAGIEHYEASTVLTAGKGQFEYRHDETASPLLLVSFRASS